MLQKFEIKVVQNKQYKTWLLKSDRRFIAVLPNVRFGSLQGRENTTVE